MLAAGIFLLGIPQGLAAAPPPIVGGETTSAYPAVGALTVEAYGETYSYCSGTLISEDFVLTAAHCIVAGQLYEDYGLTMEFLVTSDVSNPTATDERVEILAFYQHPEYNPSTLENDLGLAKLSRPLDTEPSPLLSEAPDSSWYGDELRLVGFGITGDGLSDTGVKRMVDLPVTYVEPDYIWTYDEGGTNACSGDSGGAALRDSGGGRYELAGVISFVYSFEVDQLPCSEGGAGMARFDNRMDWIREIVGDGIETEEEDTGPVLADTGAPDDPISSPGTTNFVEDDSGGCGASTVPPVRRGGAALLSLLVGLLLARRRG